MTDPFASRQLPDRHDVTAPDGSEIRLLPAVEAGSMVHCTLPPGATSLAIRHRTVSELWYVLGGAGEIWRRRDGHSETVAATPGLALSIPLGTEFQFRNTGPTPFEILIVTTPPWPGEDEAIRVADHWPVATA